MKVILCIDDEFLITQALKFQLSKHLDQSSVLVESINEPLKFFEIAKELSSLGVELKLIIVDYQMPKINGSELIRRIKLEYDDLKFIMLSGQANEIVVEELMNENLINAFFFKPWDELEVVSKVKELIN